MNSRNGTARRRSGTQRFMIRLPEAARRCARSRASPGRRTGCG